MVHVHDHRSSHIASICRAKLKPTIANLKNKFEVSYILPHSFRSALPPFLARIPKRIGLPGHFPRDFLLTDVRRPAFGPAASIRPTNTSTCFSRRKPPHLRSARLAPPPAALDAMRAKLARCLGPGSPCFPRRARHLQAMARRTLRRNRRALVARTGGSIVVLGTAGERAVCQQVAAAAAPTGSTSPAPRRCPNSPPRWRSPPPCSATTAAACTSPPPSRALSSPSTASQSAQTGPLGRLVRILQRSARRTRDVPRHRAKPPKPSAPSNPPKPSSRPRSPALSRRAPSHAVRRRSTQTETKILKTTVKCSKEAPSPGKIHSRPSAET
jgi:hypothetical protein